MAQNKIDFARYKLTAASIQWLVDGVQTEGTRFGCTGSVNAEPSVKSITIDCEGDQADSVDITEFFETTITAHIPLENYRKVYGLNQPELADGVHGYKKSSIQGEGVLTAELTDLYGRERLLIAFPNIRFSGGFRFGHDNSQTEIAQLELSARAYADANDYFYYDAEKSKVEPDIVENWHKNFTPNLMLKVPQG